MAFKIAKPSLYGVDADYWRVGVANIHPRSNACFVVMDGYLNAQARVDKMPIARVELTVPWEAFKNENNPSVRDIYLYLKNLPDWADGQDA